MNSLEIAQQATLCPSTRSREQAGLQPDEVEPYGRYKAKISLSALDRLRDRPDGKFICVAGMTPTAAGEGKTTTLVGLTQGLGAIGKRRRSPCLREPSLGPGVRRQGRRGRRRLDADRPDGGHQPPLHRGHARHRRGQQPARRDDRRVTSITATSWDRPHNITWRRAIDMNDRSLRNNVDRAGRPDERAAARDRLRHHRRVRGHGAHGRHARPGRPARAAGHASRSATTRDGKPITAEDLGAAGAMTVLLKDALKPNLVQTLEGQPCLMHCGPFANIASGNNSLVADRIGMKIADYVVTESGFGSDMGMEKFFDIVCRFGDLTPSAVVLVMPFGQPSATTTGGDDARSRARASPTSPPPGDHQAVRPARGRGGQPPPGRHRRGLRARPPRSRWRPARTAPRSTRLREGRQGRRPKLAEAVVAACDAPSDFKLLYPDEASIEDKIEAIATRSTARATCTYSPVARQKIEQFTKDGLGHLPVCMAKTQLSLSADPSCSARRRASRSTSATSAPTRAPAGSSPLCGDIMQMPGLGATPAAHNIDIDADGNTVGLF